MATEEEIEFCKNAIIARLSSAEIKVENITTALIGASFQHDCYRQALNYLSGKASSSGLHLVHGQIGPIDTDHAWIELDELDAVYDPTLMRHYKKPEYYKIQGAKLICKYSYWEAFRMQQLTGHFGPWH